MNKRLIVGLLTCALIIISCTIEKHGSIARHKKKNIKLSSISDQLKIGYETDKAIIYIGKQDAIKLTTKLLSNKKLDPRFDRTIISDLKSGLDTLNSIQSDRKVQHWFAKQSNFNLYDYNFAGFVDQWLLRELILEDKAEVWNKLESHYEKRIIYHFVRDQLGGEDAYFTFQNGTEFHRQLLRLGE